MPVKSTNKTKLCTTLVTNASASCWITTDCDVPQSFLCQYATDSECGILIVFLKEGKDAEKMYARVVDDDTESQYKLFQTYLICFYKVVRVFVSLS